MTRVVLIHRKPAEAAERAEVLRSLGYDVSFEPFSREVQARLKESPPSAVVIDLTRAPSFGRDVGVAIRTSGPTRRVVLVFVDGPPDKVARIRSLLPDATYTTWEAIGGSLARAIAHPPENPSVPASAMAAYQGTPLVKKLGIKSDSTVQLRGAPHDFEKLLVGLPDGVDVRREGPRDRDLTLWFVRSAEELERDMSEMALQAENAGLWICWPKRASGVESDVSQNVVRRIGLAAGLVDFKISSIDPTWSGLRFTRRSSG
jgi:CheY-like chemotaxis protein